MAGRSIFVTYETTTKRVVSVHLSQTAANSAVKAGTAALTGAQATAMDSHGNTVDAMQVEPNGSWYVWTQAPFVRETPVDPHPLRTAFGRAVATVAGLKTKLGDLDNTYPEPDIALARNTLHGLHQGLYLLAHRASLTTQQRIQVLTTSALGPNDQRGGVQIFKPEDAETYFELLDHVRSDPANSITPESGMKPLVVCQVYSDKSAGTVGIVRRPMKKMYEEDAKITGETNPTIFDLDRGRWPLRLTS